MLKPDFCIGEDRRAGRKREREIEIKDRKDWGKKAFEMRSVKF